MGVIVRQGIKGTIMTYAGMLIGFITTFLVLTSYLTAEEIGLTRVLIDASVLLAGLSSLGTNVSIIRFFPYFRNDEEGDHGFFFWTIAVPLIGFIIVASVYLLMSDTIVGVFSEKSTLFNQYFKAVLPLTFSLLYLGVFEVNANVLMRIVVPRFVREVLIRIGMLITYLLYAFQIISLDGMVIGICAANGIAALLNVCYLFSLKHISLKPDIAFLTRPLVRNYASYTFFLVVMSLGTIVVPNLNTFFVSAKLGLAQTGVFAIATYMATMIEIPYRSLGAISMPQISQTVKECDWDGVSRLSKNVALHQLMAGLFVFIAIWINIDLIFDILPNGDEYRAGKWVVFWLGMAKLVTSVLSVDNSVLSFSRHYYYTLFLTIVMTAATIILNNLLIPLFGISGSALATTLSCLINYGLLVIVVWFRLGVSPLSAGMLKVIGCVVLMYLVNLVWVSLYSLLPEQCSSLIVRILEGFFRSAVVLLIGVVAIYKSGVSLEVNNLISGVRNKIFNI